MISLILSYKCMSDREGSATITFHLDQENFEKALPLARTAKKKLLAVAIEEVEPEVYGRKAE